MWGAPSASSGSGPRGCCSARRFDELTRVIRHNNQVVWRNPRVAPLLVGCRAAGGQYSRLAVRINELFPLLLEMLQSQNVIDESCRAR